MSAVVRRVRQAVPHAGQRQDALSEQMHDVRAVASWLGCYDAADWISKHFFEQQRPHGVPDCSTGTCSPVRAVGQVTWLEAGPTAMNRSLKRYIDGTDGKWTCWTFTRPGQEEYHLVGVAESRGLATMWVEGRRAFP